MAIYDIHRVLEILITAVKHTLPVEAKRVLADILEPNPAPELPRSPLG